MIPSKFWFDYGRNGVEKSKTIINTFVSSTDLILMRFFPPLPTFVLLKTDRLLSCCSIINGTVGKVNPLSMIITGIRR